MKEKLEVEKNNMETFNQDMDNHQLSKMVQEKLQQT